MGKPSGFDRRPARRLRHAVLLLIAVAALPGLTGCGAGRGLDEIPFDFRLRTLSGNALGPLDFPGKVVVVDFWATWCAPCRLQERILNRVHSSLPAPDVQFLAVDLGEDEETVRKFLADHPMPYPVLLDPSNSLSYDLAISTLPTLMVLNKRGKVIYMEPGVITEEKLRGIIRKAGA